MFKFKFKYLRLALLGILIAAGIALFPQARCAMDGTCKRPADLWCWGRKCCSASGGLKYVSSCAGPVYSNYPYRCNPLSGNCNVKDWMGWTNKSFGGQRPQVGISNDRTWTTMPDCDGRGNYSNSNNWPKAFVDCCGTSGSGGSNSCTPSYAPPSIDDSYSINPPNPVPWGQEQQPYGKALGMTIGSIKAHGGADTACGSGQASITKITVQISLRQSSIDWILNVLGRRYVGVHVKGTYPQSPERPAPDHPYYACSFDPVKGIGTPNAQLDCQFFRPLDPGLYDVIVQACQSDGKCTTKSFPEPIRVWLLDTTLSDPNSPVSP
jgi:hypothetical protein